MFLCRFILLTLDFQYSEFGDTGRACSKTGLFSSVSQVLDFRLWLKIDSQS
jgi:hypothetical protein